MIKEIFSTSFIVLLFSLSCKSQTNELSNKEKVVSLLKSIETGAQEPVSYINPNKYIQHNLAVADGLAGFGALLQQLPPNSAKVNTVRVFQDGNYVFAHTEYDFFGPKIGFDIFRFEDGKIVEHWDNLQEKPASLNASGHSMIDGATKVEDIEKTEANKLFVKQFVDDILLKGNPTKLPTYFKGDNYIQHNPLIPDKVSGLVKAFQERAKQGKSMNYEKMHHIFAEGNFVLVVSEAVLAGQQYAMYDLFRVENEKIAEHWDVREEIPAKEQWKNTNGKF